MFTMPSKPMTMDRMIFECNAGVYATSLYIILCSRIDDGEKPTLNSALEVWNGTEEKLLEAAGELVDLRIIRPIEPLDFNRRVHLNPREEWAWCKEGRKQIA